MKRQVKMQISDADMKRYARVGAIQEIVDDHQRHAQIDAMLPGTLAAAIRKFRANGNGASTSHVEPVEQQTRKQRRPLSAAARKRISIGQKRRWREQRKAEKASA